MTTGEAHSEWLARKQRIDPRLDALGWPKAASSVRGAYRIEEYETDNGPADYALCDDSRVVGIVEAKKLSLGPQNVLTQAERYARGASTNPFNFAGLHVPFLYSTNGEVIWFHDQLVRVCRDVFGRGDAFVAKITGRVDRPLQRIREFRNRQNPGVVVSVDLMSTGVDIPDLENIVFLRSVQSRILFEQMLGRGTRKGERHPDKSHFTVFDCFGGTLLQRFKQATAITAEAPVGPSRMIAEIIEEIWNNRDRRYNTRCLVKRLQRIDKEMSGEARDLFKPFIPDGDVAAFAKALTDVLAQKFTDTMKLLRDEQFQELLTKYPRPKPTFIVAIGTQDTVTTTVELRDGTGRLFKPEDYLAMFSRFVQENPEHIEAIRILLDRPCDWSTQALTELREKLKQTREWFTPELLQKAHEMHHRKALVDIISMVMHAARDAEPLLTAQERDGRAFDKLTAGETFAADQQAWLDRIRAHLVENLSIDREDFDLSPVLERAGGWTAADRVFKGKLAPLLREVNEAVAA